MLEQKWQKKTLFATQKQENDWVYTPNQAICAVPPPAPLSRLAGYALAVTRMAVGSSNGKS
jgi:hypothetical protein